jgi:nucleoid-associated protein YgaU
MTPEQKKNILDQAIDLISNRDEKAAAEAAKQKAAAEANAKAAAEENAKAVAAANAKAAADKAAAEAQAKIKDLEAKVAVEENAKAVEARNADIKKMLDAQKAAEVLATHTVVAGETLSDIAMKYYKSSVREKWMKIYEANKAVIGDNPGMIKAGQVLKIPKA